MVSQEHSDPISSESEIDPSHAVRQFSFRDVSWSWSEVLIGIAPIVLSRLIPLLIDVRSLDAAPRWLWISLNVPVISWMLLYPLWIVRRRVGLLRAPSFRTVLVEVLCTLPVLGLVVIVMNLGYDMMVTLAGESYAPSDPLDSYVRSPSLLLSTAFMILAVFVVPIAEEVCFRGMVYSALRQ
jgi:membrane protease YdiL (CAAX protease family)